MARRHGTKKAGNGRSAFKRVGAHDPPAFSTNNTDIGQTVIGRSFSHKHVKKRPFHVESMLFNNSMDLVGVNGLGCKGRSSETYSSHLLVTGEYGRPSVLHTSSTTYLANRRSILQRSSPKLPPEAFADLILRRVSALLFNPYLTSNDLVSKIKGRQSCITGRRGIIFNTVSQDEILCKDPGFIALDTHDAPIEQYPFTIPGLLEQKDIDRISLIARHFNGFCTAKKLPIIWPEPGTYPNWPDAFLQFEKPQSPSLYLDLAWYDRRNYAPNDTPQFDV